MSEHKKAILIIIGALAIGTVLGLAYFMAVGTISSPSLSTLKALSPSSLIHDITGTSSSTPSGTEENAGTAPGTTTTAPGTGVLQIGSLSFSQTATNANQPIVRVSDQFKYTDTMDLSAGSGTVTLGFSSLAGGYINYFAAKGFGVAAVEGQNLDNAGYGQGWQSTLRDRMHNLRYNPAAVGFTAYRLGKDEPGAGTPVTLVDTKNSSIVVKQSNVSLYQGEGKGYDFTQYENLAKDNNTEDGGNTDEDLLPETGESQNDEIRSEFDYAGAYTNMSSTFGIPALQYDYAYAYVRPPKSILQFTNPKAVDETGAPVYVPGNAIIDISPATPGNQGVTATDLSEFLPTSGIRLYPKTFTTVLWKEGGAWKSTQSSPKGVDRTKVATCALMPNAPGYRTVGGASAYPEQTDCTVDNDVLIFATSADTKNAFAVALYAPQGMRLNSAQTWIIDKNTMGVISREDRRMQAFIGSTGGNSDIRSMLSGLRSPISLAAAGYPHAFEMVTQRQYILFGTPDQIEDAVANFQKSLAYQKAAAQ